MDQVWTWTGSGPELEKVYFIMVSAQVYFIDYETEVTCSLLGPSPGQKKCYRIKIHTRETRWSKVYLSSSSVSLVLGGSGSMGRDSCWTPD